jgi:APA family basic amino acid/polyamine antiporter
MSGNALIGATEESLPQPYTRRSTGLVREIPLLDMIGFNAVAGGGGPGIAIALILLSALTQFPGANLIVALLIAVPLCLFMWVTYGLLSATMPRTGGDYLYLSRLVHPVFGLATNIAQFVSAVLAAGLIGWLIPVAGLVPAFTIIGRVTNSKGWLDAANTLSTKGWTLGIAIAAIVALSGLSILGTKVAVRAMSLMILVGIPGFLLALGVMLFKSHASFVSALNNFSEPFTHTKDTYSATVEAGAKAGLQYPDRGHGYSTSATIGALITTVFFFYPFMWSIYMAGEMKGAGRRSRQLTAIIGTALGQGLLVIISVVVFLHMVGYDFYTAANSGSYGVDVAPYYSFFSAVAAHNSIVSIVIGLTFLAWFLPSVYIDLAMAQRAPFAWAFDGVIPKRIAAVNSRTHTPIIAITIVAAGAIASVVWVTYSANFFTILSAMALLAMLQFALVGLAAMLMPYLRPQIYANSPADWRVWGLPVLPIAGAGCALSATFVMGLIIHFHAAVGIEHARSAYALLVGSFVVAILVYFGAKAVQLRRGVDISLVYKTIPPE